mgnify:CR=1 FL=1
MTERAAGVNRRVAGVCSTCGGAARGAGRGAGVWAGAGVLSGVGALGVAVGMTRGLTGTGPSISTGPCTCGVRVGDGDGAGGN